MSFFRKNCLSLIKLGTAFLLKKNYPFVAVLRLNDSCNMSCHYCDSYKLTKSIEIQSLINFLENIYKKGCRFLILTGGEVFLYKDRKKLLDWIQGKGIYLVINTNGKLIAGEDYKQFLQAADEVLISLDGPAEYNDQHRGSGNHDKVMQTLDYLKKIKKKITISVVLTKLNTNNEVYDYIKEIKLKFGASVGINPVTSNGRINNESFSNSNAVSVEKLKEFRSYIDTNSKSFREIPSLLLDYLVSPSPFVCKTMNYALYVDVDHGIYPCINVTGREDAKFSDIRTYNGKYQKKIECLQCNCTPLIMGNLMFQEGRIPSFKKAFSIIKRHL